MSNKIYGDDATIKRAKAAKPGDKTVLINWDAIEELPDQYEIVVSEVKFDIAKDFSDVGNGNYMPAPDLCYKIAEAKGIKGCGNAHIEPIYEDVDTSEMTMADIPVLQKMLVGYRCSKQSTVTEEDGTERPSSVCTIDYNVWNRVTEMWATEEKYTDGYSRKGKYDNKYDTKWKRKSHFKSELKFAMQKAETKAHVKTIRELAGLMTGYRAIDLKEGRMIFAKVRRSRKILQAEAAAHLVALSNGKQDSEPIDLLFGAEPAKIADTITETTSGKGIPASVVNNNTIKTPKERVLEAIDKYKGSIDDSLIDRTDALVSWIDGQDSPETTPFWANVIDHLKAIEDSIPEDFRVEHGLY